MINIKRQLPLYIVLIIAFIFGVLLIILGTTILIKVNSWVLVENAVVTKLKPISTGENEVYVTYTFNSKLYEDILLDIYDPTVGIGDLFDIKVNPNNPTQISSNYVFDKYAFFIGGGFLTLSSLGLFLFDVFKRKSKRSVIQYSNVDNSVKAKKNVVFDYSLFNENQNKTYYFHPGNKEIHFYIEENEKHVFEARCLKTSAFKPNEYLFTNYINNSSISYRISANSVFNEINSFKINGVIFQTYLGQRGLRFEINEEKEVLLIKNELVIAKGKEIAKEKENNSSYKLPTMDYEILTIDEYIDDVFILMFSFIRQRKI